jgi:hypothetical protein
VNLIILFCQQLTHTHTRTNTLSSHSNKRKQTHNENINKSIHSIHSIYIYTIILISTQNTGGFYKCNRFDAIKTDGSSSAAQKAKAELERYLHYYQRFHGHDSALKFAAGQREAAERRMVERQEAQRSTWIDVQFLKHAAEQVITILCNCYHLCCIVYIISFKLLFVLLLMHLSELL